jgi:hypothetical protein
MGADASDRSGSRLAPNTGAGGTLLTRVLTRNDFWAQQVANNGGQFMKQSLAPAPSRRPRGGASFLKVASFLGLLACGSTEPIEKNLLLEGMVTDASNGAPIAGATVSVGYPSGPPSAIVRPITTVASTTSDSQGRYTLSHMGCVNEPYISVGAAGYYNDDERVGCKPGTQTVNLSLTRDPSAP